MWQRVWLLGVLLLLGIARGEGGGGGVSARAQARAQLAALPPHPRIRLTDSQLNGIRQNIARYKLAATFNESLIEHALSLLKAPPINCSRTGVESTILAQARAVLDMQYTLGLAYRLTNESTFAQRAIAEMLHVVNDCPDWNPAHFLDVAEMTHAVSIGYDWLFHVIPADRRAVIEKGVLQKGIEAGVAAYKAKAWWATDVNNWNLVCNGGLSIGALAFGDVPAITAGAEEIIANATANIPISLVNFGPDGAWYEGEGYWGYSSEYILATIDAFLTATNTDHGWLKTPGLAEAALFRIYGAGPSNRLFDWADANGNVGDAQTFFALAHHFPEWRPLYSYEARQISNPKCGSACPLSLLYYVEEGGEADLLKLPTSKVFHFLEWNKQAPPMANGFFRASWQGAKESWVGFRGGHGGSNHNDVDAGTFVLELGGVRWAIDLGPDSYGLPGYFSIGSGDRQRFSYYRKSTHGHNTLTFGGYDGHPGPTNQAFQPYAPIVTFNGSYHAGPFAVIDMTPVYKTQGASRVVRGIAFVGYNELLVVDEFDFKTAPNFTWAIHTVANITLQGQRATLTQGGAELSVRIKEGESFLAFSEKEVKIPPPQTAFPGLHKLMVSSTNVTGVKRLGVSFALSSTPVSKLKINPLEKWATEGPATPAV